MRFFVLLLIAIGCIGIFVQPVHAAESLKVVTFNVQRGSPGWDCEVSQTPRREPKVSPIADYIIRNKIDVILLQEMINFLCDSDPYDETVRLSQILAERGYPMEYAVVPQSIQDNGMHVPIFSRYPIVREEVEYIPDDDDWRIYIRVPIQTPLGKIYFYNAHIHHQDPCEGLPIFIGKVRSDNARLAVVGADFNTNLNRNPCGVNMVDDFHIEVWRESLDYLAIPKNKPLFYEQTSTDERRQDPNGITGPPLSDHRPVIAMINTTEPPATATPVLTPTPTPIPLQKSCSVQLSAPQIQQNGSVTVRVQASSSRSTDENVGIFFNRQDNAKMPQLIPNTVESSFEGRYYYAITPLPCQTSATNTCDRSIQVFSIPAGTYRVFCDVAQPPNACSGNPNCQENGGTINCTTLGFNSCSATDVVTLRVAGKPGDVTGDGKVDIFDYNKILEFFGENNCEYNLVETCRIDIFDFNTVLTHFGT